MQTKSKLNSKETFNIFSFAFGVFCFGFVISSVNYVWAGVKLFNFDISSVIHMLVYFLIINVAVSVLISIFLPKITSIRFVNSLLLSLFIYFTTAQLYLHFCSKLNISASLAFSVGIFISSIFFLSSFVCQLNTISSLVRTLSDLSSISTLILVILLIFYPTMLTTKDLKTRKNNNTPQFNNSKDIYKNFRSSSKKKLSLFIILFDEIPFTLISDGNLIKDCFPNLKALSNKSLFFTKAFSNYDGTRRSIPSIFTGKYVSKKYYNNNYMLNDWLSEDKNIFVDLEECGYSIDISEQSFGIRNKLYPDIAAGNKFYTEDVFVRGTFNFIETLYSFGIVDFYDYHFFAPKSYVGRNEIINLKGKLAFCYMCFAETHDPYTFLREGEEKVEKPNSYYSCDNNELYAVKPIPFEEAPLVNKKQIEELMYFDKLLGEKIKDILNNLGEDSVLIIFLSDHGIGWRPPHLGREAGYINWDIVGVPLMIYCPSRLKPEVYDKPFPLIDLLPTIYDLIGIEYKEEEFDGKSFFNKQREKREDIFSYSGGCQYALQGDSWEEGKVAFSFVPGGKTEPIGNIGSECLKNED